MSEKNEGVRVLIISRMTHGQTEAFYERLGELNQRVNSSFRPTSLEETDVAFYLLNSWEDADSAPGAQELQTVFLQLSDVQSPTFVRSVWVDVGKDRELRFFFYSHKDGEYAPLECFARHLAVEIDRKTLTDDFRNDALSVCLAKSR